MDLNNIDNHIARCLEHMQCNFTLKDLQRKCVVAIASGKDVMAILPTGYGKSIIFQILPYLFSCINNIPFNQTSKIILVISPLNSLITDQCTGLSLVWDCTHERLIMSVKQHASATPTVNDFIYSDAEENNEENDIDADNGKQPGILRTQVTIRDVVNGCYQVVFNHPEALISTTKGRALLENPAFQDNLVAVGLDEANIFLQR